MVPEEGSEGLLSCHCHCHIVGHIAMSSSQGGRGQGREGGMLLLLLGQEKE